MKRLCLLILLMCTLLTGWAAKERNYIFVFDCTQSMDGYGGAPKVWSQAKNFLKRNIERKSSESTITIVPFQGKALTPIKFERKDFNWAEIEQKLNEYIVNITDTNIKDAWNVGNEYIDPKKNNYLFLLTDGKDKDPKALYNILGSWCGKYPDTTAYYVSLTSNSEDPEIKEIINQCADIIAVDSSENVEDFGTIENPSITIQIDDIAAGKSAVLGFSDEGHFPGNVTNSDVYFDVSLVGDISSTVRLNIKPKSGRTINELRQELDDTYSFEIQIESPAIKILNPTVDIKVINKPLAILDIEGLENDETQLDDCSYYPSFLGIFKASEPGQTSIDLKPAFNDVAKKRSSTAAFKVSGKDGFTAFHVLYNGVDVKDNKFEIRPGETESMLTIVFDEEAQGGKHYFNLTSLPSDFEIINGQEVSASDPYTTSLRAEYEVNWNPWKTFFFWLMIMVLALFILWMLMLKPFIYPSIKGVTTIMVTSPYYSSKRVRGAYKVIYSSTKIKQGVLSRIFKGKIINEVNAVWSTPFELTAGTKGLRVKPNGDYAINPYATTLKRGAQYIINVQNPNNKINITIN